MGGRLPATPAAPVPWEPTPAHFPNPIRAPRDVERRAWSPLERTGALSAPRRSVCASHSEAVEKNRSPGAALKASKMCAFRESLLTSAEQ